MRALLAINISTSSPWFYVLCIGVLLLAVAVILYCLLRRSRSDAVAATPNDLVGKTGVVAEEVDADAGTGLVIIDGEGWAARPVYVDDVYAVDATVQVLAVEGVKLIVRAVE